MSPRVLRLEFVPGASRAVWVGRVAMATVLVVVAAEAVQLANAMNQRRQTLAALSDFDRSTVTTVAVRKPAHKPDAAYLARVRTAQRVARDLTTPWAELLDAIESAPQQSVALLAVVPSSSKRSIRLTAEARDLQAMLGYLAALQEDSRLGSVVLVTHQEQSQAPGKPVRFQLQAEWGGGKQ